MAMTAKETSSGHGSRKATAGWLPAAVILPLVLALSACGVVKRAPEIGSSALKAANPLNWFGGDGKDKDPANGDPADGEGTVSKPTPAMPGSATLGTVHMVERRNDFLLIKASRLAKVEYGTALISQNANGQQTAELKLSPERNAQFLVADIVRGDPEVGDVVKMVGVRGEDGTIGPAGGDEVQVLE
jgi:hypothetical protein